MRSALAVHYRSDCACLRHNLQGKPVEPVAPEHVHHAILELYKRRSGKAPEQARQLPRALHLARRQRAFDARGRLTMVAQRARREALQNAFKASGKTVAEFAEMYGLDLMEAKRLLA
ncbi:MAG TPA: hypothetical protein VLK85_20395 [Ramlibacter sp.]|nr:hypothetical protein [Ramlibacter sp.]